MAIIPDIVERMALDSPAIALRTSTRTRVHWGVPPPAPAGRERNNPGTINAPLCRNTMLILGDLVRSEHGRGGLRSGPREPTKYALLTSGGLALPVDLPRHNSQHVGQPELIGATARCATLSTGDRGRKAARLRFCSL
jgi:hypothetical protein